MKGKIFLFQGNFFASKPVDERFSGQFCQEGGEKYPE
jgi:hypothetical protein